MRRITSFLFASLIVFGLMAPVARADVQGVGVFQGVADVGRHFVDNNDLPVDCTKGTVKVATARGQGLYAPPPVGSNPKNGVWSFHTTFTAAGTKNDGTAGPITGFLDACGWLQHPLKETGGVRLGPTCAFSKGHNGRGQANFDGGGGINIFDIQWKTSAGPYIPITAKYQAWAVDGVKGNKGKKNKWGNAIAMVFVNPSGGGLECLTPKNCPNQKTAAPNTPDCGAQNFTVVGVFALVQALDRNMDGKHGKDEVFRPNDVPYFCKDTADPECLWDSKKSDKEPLPPTKTS